MATDVLAEKFETRLHLTTKTVGEDRIKKAKENNEDVAVLSTFLPSPDDGKKKNVFECALKEECLLGDPKKAVAGMNLYDLYGVYVLCIYRWLLTWRMVCYTNKT
jgi:hypothetical protein